tara:strand:+ start:366 stop:1088 length:723 start_codon:yes stop_codon:yes gene_type:complete
MNNSKIAINGFYGRMGQAIFNLSLVKNFTVTVGIDKQDKLETIEGLKLSDSLTELKEFYDVVIDFSLPEPSVKAVKECESLGKPITIGTTGFTDEQRQMITDASKRIPILLAPNMSKGVNASLQTISDLSRLLSDYEVSIEETHHKNKVDSPSGTALKIAEVVANARNIKASDINITSYREEGEIGVHKTVFKSDDDEIIIYHNAFNRKIFAKGALETSQWIAKQKPGLYTYKSFMEDIT